MSKESGKRLYVDPPFDDLDEEDQRVLFMREQARRASEALLSATDKRDSISTLIGYQAGRGDKVRRKQALANSLSLFQNVWDSEEPYAAPGSWQVASSINFFYEKLAGLVNDVAFLDTEEVKISLESSNKPDETDFLDEVLAAVET